jgi:hypothetical protein
MIADCVGENEWIEIGDRLPYCADDCVSPVRVAGREIGKPRGELERLIDGEWVPIGPDNPMPTIEEAIRQAVELTKGRSGFPYEPGMFPE